MDIINIGVPYLLSFFRIADCFTLQKQQAFGIVLKTRYYQIVGLLLTKCQLYFTRIAIDNLSLVVMVYS
jgi:hypothetical protein